MWNRRKDDPAFQAWESNHICPINHKKSSGAMESAGAVEIFSRSLSSRDLIYKYYLGDGDSSAFSDVVASK